MAIQAVFFDAGNTLLYAHPNEAVVLAEKARLVGERLDMPLLADSLRTEFRGLEALTMKDASFWGNHQLTRSIWVDFYTSALHRIGLDGIAPGIADEACTHFASSSAWKIYPEAVEVLKKLGEKGIVRGIVSNWDLNLPDICSDLGLTDHLEFLIASGRVGLSKPYPEIFHEAVKRSGLPIESCLMVGDHYFSDVLGARSIGLEAVLIDRHGISPDADCTVITDLGEIMELL